MDSDLVRRICVVAEPRTWLLHVKGKGGRGGREGGENREEMRRDVGYMAFVAELLQRSSRRVRVVVDDLMIQADNAKKYGGSQTCLPRLP
jgi:hypothetical protein